jgi:hypothetical protein
MMASRRAGAYSTKSRPTKGRSVNHGVQSLIAVEAAPLGAHSTQPRLIFAVLVAVKSPASIMGPSVHRSEDQLYSRNDITDYLCPIAPQVSVRDIARANILA